MAFNVNCGVQNFLLSIQRGDSLNDVNSQINQWQTRASTLPFRHPDRAMIAAIIAVCHMSRYEATQQKGDLDRAIVGCTEALLRGMNDPPNNISNFWLLTRALLIRFRDFGAKEELDHIISYLRNLPNLPLEVPGINHLNLLKDLAYALHSRFEVGGQLEDIGDLILLLRLVIATVPPGTDDYRHIASKLGNA